jgi:hypothetical protein
MHKELFQMKKYFYTLATLILLISFIVFRLIIRQTNPLGIDEEEEITHLTSFSHLIRNYLPSIPGGAPGHYLLLLPINTIFPWNKIMLGLPGLFGNIAVFIFLPKAIRILFPDKVNKIPLISLIARLGLVFDPVLSYQSIEIRPYSLLPLLWLLCVFVTENLIRIRTERKNIVNSFLMIIKYILFLTLIFIWHYYGIIIFMSIYFFMNRKNMSGINFFSKRYFQQVVIILSVLISFPVLKYFLPGSLRFEINTVDYIFSGLTNYVDNYRIYFDSIPMINSLFFVFISILPLLIIYYIFRDGKNIVYRTVQSIREILGIFIYMIATPVVIILTLDIINRYWFLLRQFSWVLIPSYICLGIFISNLISVKSESFNDRYNTKTF